eukprot:8731547-Alexandrium_andersonii.AAC.1
MSASLVGSEMCIRDRNCTPQFSAAFCAAALMLLHSSSGPRGAIEPLWRGCLLYTSDAADDM